MAIWTSFDKTGEDVCKYEKEVHENFGMLPLENLNQQEIYQLIRALRNLDNVVSRSLILHATDRYFRKEK